MSEAAVIRLTRVTEHVIQLAVPTPTLPPSFETNTYLIFEGEHGLLVDAGSKDPDMIANLCKLVNECGVTHIKGILATHYHRDHTEGIPLLLQRYDVPVYIHPLDLERAAREMRMSPDMIQDMPGTLQIGSVQVTLEHVPGHTHGHVHIIVQPDGVILVGDHLAGDGSVWIGPPDGHMANYFEALDKIANSGFAIAGPGHGQVLQDAKAASLALKSRRMAREAEICALITEHPRTVAEILDLLYRGTLPENALWVAKKTIQAHLEHLLSESKIVRAWDSAREQFFYTASTPD